MESNQIVLVPVFFPIEHQLTHLGEQFPLILQKGPVVASLGYGLGAAQVEVHGVTLILHQLGRREKRVGIIGAELQKIKQ